LAELRKHFREQVASLRRAENTRKKQEGKGKEAGQLHSKPLPVYEEAPWRQAIRKA